MKTSTIDTRSISILKLLEPLSLQDSNTLSFRPATLDCIGILKEYIDRYPSRSCDFSIGGILLWADYFHYSFAEYSDTLFLKGEDDHGVFFHQPLGALSPEEGMSIIRDYCSSNHLLPRIIIPGECDVDNIDEYESSHDVYLPDWREYMYNIEQFLRFSGKKMEKKRNHLNYFMNHFADYEMEILDGSRTQKDQLVEFNEKFNLYHKDGDTFDYESNAIGRAIEEYERYPFFGLLIRYEGHIIGYTFGEAVGDTFIIHAEKGDIEYRGVYQALSSLLSREVAEIYPEIRYLNREDDMGNDYLRQSKLSYHPTKFIAKWEISA
ncbi:MAG: phosphatidylglycerol lysyltransferase domain-containing protein [Muribaculaceae bacterium]|nr:phosphatidylglycerol lysyltransferase domain-containing protein [Muribaculaceae bacterium]